METGGIGIGNVGGSGGRGIAGPILSDSSVALIYKQKKILRLGNANLDAEYVLKINIDKT